MTEIKKHNTDNKYAGVVVCICIHPCGKTTVVRSTSDRVTVCQVSRCGNYYSMNAYSFMS